MRKLAVISLAVAALLLSGCNQKKEEHETVKKAASSQSVVSSSQAMRSSKVAPEPLPGVPMEPVKKVQNSEPAEVKVHTTGQKAQEKVTEGTKKLKEAAATATATVDGGKLFTKCASCHGPKGDRKALGKSAVIAGMAKDEVLKKLKGYQAGTLNQYGMGPLMKGQVAGLSEADLEALADYISKLK